MSDEPNRDTRLLRDYVVAGSEPAFRELVAQYLPLVNATALRLVNGDAHLAQDVAQIVFSDLARKARSLSSGVLLGGWLYRHTCFTASKVVRTERARRVRDHAAFEMNSLLSGPGPDDPWAKIAPVLDDALGHLNSEDRDALVLRFFEQRDLRSIGQVLGTGEDAAQKRVSRALEKLRAVFLRRGLPLSSTLLAATLEVHAVAPVSAALTATVSATALSGAAVSTGLTLTTLQTMLTSKVALVFLATVATVSAAAYVALTPAPTPPAIHVAAPAAAPAPIAKTIPPVPAPVVVATPPPIRAIAPAPFTAAPPPPPSPAPQSQPDNSYIVSNNPVTVTGTITKVGSGTFILNDGSTPYNYTGQTTVTSGTLVLSTADSGVINFSGDASGSSAGTVYLINADSTLVDSAIPAAPGAPAPTQVILRDGTVQNVSAPQP